MSDVIEQLRAAFSDLTNSDFDDIDRNPALLTMEGWEQSAAAYMAVHEITKLRAERDALRAALEQIRYRYDATASREIAYAALRTDRTAVQPAEQPLGSVCKHCGQVIGPIHVCGCSFQTTEGQGK